MEKHEEIINRLEHFKVDKKLTWRGLAQQLGITTSTISQFKTGARNLSPRVRRRFIEEFGKDVYLDIFGYPVKSEQQKLWETIHASESSTESGVGDNHTGQEGADE